MNKKILGQICYLGFFSAGVLASEIILTRIFSVVFWYHFGFLVLSTAMLGFGIGGFLVRYHADKLKNQPQKSVLSTGSIASGMALILALLVLTNNPFHVSDPKTSTNTIALCMGLELLSTSFMLIVPFTIMGAVTLFMLQREKDNVGPVYAANLAGSAMGCLAAIVLMNMGGGIKALVFVASLLVLSGILTSWPELKKTSVLCGILALLIPCTLFFNDSLFPIKSPQGKPATTIEPSQMVMTDWTSLARVDIYKEKNWQTNEFGLWGLSPAKRSLLPERLGVLIDYWAYTTILKHSAEPGYYDFLENLPMYGMYRITPLNPEMMIIGSGGGMDIRAGLHFGASHIDAVEINPSIFKVMTDDYADYSGTIYRDPKVTAHLGEGRNVLSSSDKIYDIIQLSGVDTFSATQAGAFALTENYLYTMEAFNTYLNHLKPQGLLSLTHWYLPSTTGYPRFSLRLFCLAYSALKAQGISEPDKHMFFFHSKRFAVLLAKKVPFSQTEIQTLSDLCTEKQYICLFRPDRVIFSSMHFYSFVKSPDKQAWFNGYPFNVSPPTDDSPFYFENRKFGTIFNPGNYIDGYTRFDGQTILIALFIELLLASSILVIGSFRMEKKNSDIKGWLYFFCIGMGFMLAEVSFAQQLVLFLGHPVYALSVVLFSILLFSGIGSYYAKTLAKRLPVPLILLVVSLIFAVQAFFGIPIIRGLSGMEPLLIRIGVAVLFLGPVSFLMGSAFPEAASRLCDSGRTESLGIYWAFNSFASVLGAVLAIIIAIASGFTAVMLVACLCYILAAVFFPKSP